MQKSLAISPTQKAPTISPTQKASESSSKPPVKKNQPLPQSPLRRSLRNGPSDVPKENHKCKLIEISGKNQVVVEGLWASDNPYQTVHFVPLEPNAVKVWVDIVKVSTAAVWRQSTEIGCIGDAIGSPIAWPNDKVKLCKKLSSCF